MIQERGLLIHDGMADEAPPPPERPEHGGMRRELSHS